jgi:hypothetical protein
MRRHARRGNPARHRHAAGAAGNPQHVATKLNISSRVQLAAEVARRSSIQAATST